MVDNIRDTMDNVGAAARGPYFGAASPDESDEFILDLSDFDDDSDTNVWEKEADGSDDRRHRYDRVYDVLHESPTVPLYYKSRSSSLVVTLLLLNCARMHNSMNTFINKLLRLLHGSILPETNSLPKSEYEA